jgi:uncharacterized protein
MRRKEQQITDKADIEEIIRQAPVCRLGLCDGGVPYIVPVCFGYKDNLLYFHSAGDGTKMEILDRNNLVCFEMDIDVRLKVGSRPCDWGMNYLSVIGTGHAHLIENPAEKAEAMDIIMAHYNGPAGGYDPDTLKKTIVIGIEIESLTGKKSGY